MWPKRDVMQIVIAKLCGASFRSTSHFPSLSGNISNKCSGKSIKTMSDDPAAGYEFDYFSLLLPLPYRVALAIVLGVWAWGAALQYFSLVKIDIASLINPQRDASQTSPPAYTSTYRLALILTVPLVLSLFIFWSLSQRNPSLVIYYEFLPMTYFIILFGIFLLPIRPFCSPGRSRFLATLRRISIGGLAHSKDGKFGDIILADVLTSYAKIIADLFIVLCMFFSKESVSATAKPNRTCGGLYLSPIVNAIPFLIRLRQCLTEFLRVQPVDRPDSGARHLANALKYTTSLPVIAFAALRHSISLNSNMQNVGLTEETIHYCWLTAIFVNSCYSFYWDVTHDWDLTLFPAFFEYLNPTRRPRLSNQFHVSRLKKTHSFGLRPSLFLTSPDLYYLAIIFDLLLRFSWLIRLGPSLGQFADSESGITLLEFAEVCRRWIWIFLRSDAEWVRQYEEKEDSEIDNFVPDHSEHGEV